MPATREPPRDDAREERDRVLAELFGAAPADAPPAESEPASGDRDERLAALFASPPPQRPVDVGSQPARPPAWTPVTDPATRSNPQHGWGSFGHAPRRGVFRRAGARGTAVVAVALIAGVVVGSLYASHMFAADAQRLQTAVAEYEAQADRATAGRADLAAAVEAYHAMAQTARAAADAAGSPLLALAGMSDQVALDAANAARQRLVDILDSTSLPEDPGEYVASEAGELSELETVEAATESARAHSARIAEAAGEVERARRAVEQSVAALAEAQRVLGGTLPATAGAIVAENALADEELRTAVTAAAAAVVAAQSAGGSGNAEMLAYAAAVVALRDEHARAAERVEARRAPRPDPEPAPVPEPQPRPEPQPPPEPQPEPEPTPQPEPTP